MHRESRERRYPSYSSREIDTGSGYGEGEGPKGDHFVLELESPRHSGHDFINLFAVGLSLPAATQTIDAILNFRPQEDRFR